MMMTRRAKIFAPSMTKNCNAEPAADSGLRPNRV